MQQDLYPPSPETLERARIKSYEDVSRRAAADPEAYWEKEASELEWFEPWNQVLDWQAPFAKWFLG
ncbi:MAG TPA: acetyl-coenzyme A synthetase N-terminal domain-containing protein, partial [Myxococcota bacterium]|nr:acetyl-coenzyme A synthetase N-terminal domain-containing protein [Myxococcota bacterium]